MTSGTYVRRTVSFLRGGRQCELRHRQNFASDVCDTSVHHSVLIIEYPHAGSLPNKPPHVLFSVPTLDSDKHQKPLADL